MKTVKFVNKDKGQFTSTLRKNVNDYFKQNGISSKGNWKMLLKALILISAYFTPFILTLFLPMPLWLVLPLSILMGIGMAGIGMSVMHDAAHGSFSRRAWINKFFTQSMYFIGGNPFNWKIQHNVLHHTYTNIDGFDEDIEPKGSLRLSKQSPLKKIHRFQHIYAFFLYCLMTLSRTVSEFFKLSKYNRTGITKAQGGSPKKQMVWLAFTKATYFAVFIGLPMIFSPLSWWVILSGFILMHFTAGFLMATVFQMAHVVEIAAQPIPDQSGVIDNEWMAHELETTVNFSKKSRVFAWLIGGLNYQIEHHLFPNVCHIHYRKIAPIVERTAKEFGLPYHENRTFVSALGSHMRMLHKLGRGQMPAV